MTPSPSNSTPEPYTPTKITEAMVEAAAEVFYDSQTGTVGLLSTSGYAAAWRALARAALTAALAAAEEPAAPELWRCTACNYPWPVGEGNPNMGKWDRCTICANDEWVLVPTKEPLPTPDLPGFEGTREALDALTIRREGRG